MKIPGANRCFHDPMLSLEWIKDKSNLITKTHSKNFIHLFQIEFLESSFRIWLFENNKGRYFLL